MQIIFLRPTQAFLPLILNIPAKIIFWLGVGGTAVAGSLGNLQLQRPLVGFWGEWPSGLKHQTQNRKDLASNLTRCTARLRDPTSLQGSNKCLYAVINIWYVGSCLYYSFSCCLAVGYDNIIIMFDNEFLVCCN